MASAAAAAAPGSGASTPATAAGRGGAGAGGAGALSRFRPKNVRRDADERKKLEEQRSRDLAAKIKVEERELAKEERRARRGGRGRGDAMSQRGTMRRGGASGPFSAMPQGECLCLMFRSEAKEGGGYATSILLTRLLFLWGFSPLIQGA